MVDRDLADLYDVSTGRLNEQVRRNIKRFPQDFMFQLSKRELEDWKSQIAISNKEKMGLRKCPLVFTEQGIAMLSSVLNSDRAIQVNIVIMRIFVKIREILINNKSLALKLNQLERKIDRHDGEIQAIMDAIRQLITDEKKPKGQIGFHSV